MTVEKRFLVEFELESHSCLVDGLSEQKISSSDGTEYFLSNLSTDIGNEHPILCLRIVLDAADFGAAEQIAKEKAKLFQRCFGFCTSTLCNIIKLTQIVDWTPGLKDRDAQIFTTHAGHDLPHKVVDGDLLRTVQGILSLSVQEEILQALKWHHYGLLCEYTDEKFHYFWLAIEALVQIPGDISKVNDLCPRCRRPLYCEKCDDHPTHRPYPKQKIEQYFKKINPRSGQKIFDDATRVRNVISHGSDLTNFIETAKIDFDDLVNTMGHMAFYGIVNALQRHSGLSQEKMKYLFHRPNTFIRGSLVVKSHISFSTRNPEMPDISDLPGVQQEIIISEKLEG